MIKPERIWVLVAKKNAGEATPEELEELNRLIAENVASGYSHDVISKIWDAPLVTSSENKISGEVWQRIQNKTGGQTPARSRYFIQRPYWMAAASLLVFVSAALFYFQGYKLPAGNNSDNARLNQVSTRAGSKSKLELPDGTQVWLNGNSRLTYSSGSFNRDNREVVLTGEAYFDVVKNASLPFIIHTGPVNITVKGTAFNVKAYPKEKTVETVLVRGLVEITTSQDPDRKILLKPNEKIVIPVNEPAQHEEKTSDTAIKSLFAITKFSPAEKEPAEIAWINTQLLFDNEPLGSIAPKMESWYNIHIHFVDESLRSKRFSGIIEKETLKETLEAMQLSWHFKYKIEGNDLWLGEN